MNIEILSWEDLSGNSAGSTAAANVQLLSDAFAMPQLNRNRRIWLYLPPDYQISVRSYPVIYMHDGQNLFDNTTSFSGEWGIDETLNQLFPADSGVIVVGIDNGGSNRTSEYSPWVNPQYGGGQGDLYARFIVETLKPYIDQHFRTKPERDFTATMGSSMGGLISYYTGLKYQQVFSKIGIFSPSFWFSSGVLTFADTITKKAEMKIYFVAGQNESSTMVSYIQSVRNGLIARGFSDDEIKINIKADGQHSEWFWRREFQEAYQWLFAQTPITATATPNPASSVLNVYPNPSNEYLLIAPPTESPFVIELHNTSGELIVSKQFYGYNKLYVGSLPNGIYRLSYRGEAGLLQKMVVIQY